MINPCPDCGKHWSGDEPATGEIVDCECGACYIPRLEFQEGPIKMIERLNISDSIPEGAGLRVELPDNNPKTRAGGMNKVPLHLIPPAPKVYLAMALADGGFKYRPFNYEVENISASVYYGAQQRHVDDWWTGANLSKDAKVKHLAAAIACLWLLLDAEVHGTLNDNRPPAFDLEALMDEQSEILDFLRNRESTKFDLHDIPSGSE